jgi:ABC-type lipoprotein release transport system permease subunit
MREYFKLAWRSIWRNKRRALITAASIFFAIIIAIIMRSFQLGSYDHMIHNVVETYTGYLQVQHEDYRNKRTINNTFVYTDSIERIVSQTDNIAEVYPRLESFALASSGNSTKGAFVMGIIPEKEDHMTNASQKIVQYQLKRSMMEQIIKDEEITGELKTRLEKISDNAFTSDEDLKRSVFPNGNTDEDLLLLIKERSRIPGEYLHANDQSVLVAEKLARFLNVSVGDTMILISQGLHGISASGLYPVSGIIKIPNPELNRSFIYMPLAAAQQFYSAPDRLTSLAVNLENEDDQAMFDTKDALEAQLAGSQFVVRDWQEMNPELVQQIESDDASGKIMIGVLYLIIGFGIFSTVLMMTAERKREFGVMVAIGMKKMKLSLVVMIELFFMGLLGIVSGMIVSIPLVLLGYYNPIRLTGELAASMESFGMEPIMPLAMIDSYYLNQAWVIIAIMVVVMIYPVTKILRLKEIDALRA